LNASVARRVRLGASGSWAASNHTYCIQTTDALHPGVMLAFGVDLESFRRPWIKGSSHFLDPVRELTPEMTVLQTYSGVFIIIVMYRQGDLLLERVEALPAGLQELDHHDDVAVLAEGEVTGHRHTIRSPGVRIFAEPQQPQVTYLEIAEALAALEHEEHAAIRLEKGVYRVTRQREYLPRVRSRPVQD